MKSLVLYCRPGFENDLAAEVQDKSTRWEVFGYVKAQKNSGFVVFEGYEQGDGELLARKLKFSELIFARQMFASSSLLTDLPLNDRLTPIMEHLADFPLCGDVRVEVADTNEAKELSKFCRKFSVPLRQALRKASKLTDKPVQNRPVLHVFFVEPTKAYVGFSYSYNNSPFYMGIPRLKFPAGAPSRSTLKLEEAMKLFVPEEESEERITSGMNAVDIGAAPGGWTHYLVNKGMMVSAVDNGPMDEVLMETGQVKHFMEDGFKFEPKKKNIYWLVCDMVEKPNRVARLMTGWVIHDWCKEALFNLKLPMKQRHLSVEENLNMIRDMLNECGVRRYQLQAKHLYHNREEITVHLRKL